MAEMKLMTERRASEKTSGRQERATETRYREERMRWMETGRLRRREDSNT